MKRVLSLFLAALFGLLMFPMQADATAEEHNFKKVAAYQPFSDVTEDAWYYANVKTICEYGLMNGKGNNTFDPNGTLTYHEGITLACRLHKLYHEGSSDFEPSDPWYKIYMDYADDHGMNLAHDVVPEVYWLNSSTSYDENTLRRNVFIKMISLALPDDALAPINSVEDGSIPDISLYTWDEWCRDDVYRLYRAGIITGKDEKGTFDPYMSLTRAETAAILSRVIDQSLRKKVELQAPAVKESLTEATARNMVESLNMGEIKRIVCTDFDYDGKNEAFVITEGERHWSNRDYFGDKESYIWFVSGGRVDCLCSCPGEIGFDEAYLYDDFENLKIFRAWGDVALRYHVEGAGFVMYTVRDGKAELFDLPNYQVQEDELFPGVEPYEMFPIGTMYGGRIPKYLPDQKAYLITTIQTIYKKSELGSASPFITTECLLEVNEKTHEFEWTMRRLSLSEDGYYVYEKAKAYIEANGTDGWIPSPEKKVQDGIVDW